MASQCFTIAALPENVRDVRIVQAFADHKTATATVQYRRQGFKELAEAVREMVPGVKALQGEKR